MRYKLFGTAGTCEYYAKEGIKMSVLLKPQSAEKPNVVDWIQKKDLDLVINVLTRVNPSPNLLLSSRVRSASSTNLLERQMILLL